MVTLAPPRALNLLALSRSLATQRSTQGCFELKWAESPIPYPQAIPYVPAVIPTLGPIYYHIGTVDHHIRVVQNHPLKSAWWATCEHKLEKAYREKCMIKKNSLMMSITWLLEWTSSS